ncbi:EPIDERMAL PATTERNING FACTOR-like protein 5 [Hibiscus syriacus]|uniref:Epidermal patterning factor-like protein n=1 Tax=Hibiscus syriacus TaxID=106335 RepID=A0A6A3CFS6_HIBSY|nr:EPIDERMAL PATTERNING FACTOR-like protein 5 [Hibiscus syriacus]KAE8728165.1 EPIDERMAL PATTERNING FACTOR-like protein 5 [Hibiscus syriacus]
MGVSPHRYCRRRRLHHHIVAVLTFLLFASASVRTLSQLESGFREREGSKKRCGSGVVDRFLSQKKLIGLGSQPPSCRSNCGSCSPCKPVHIPIQPGLMMPLQYYPEAWRCRCGNKIFMP